MTDFTFHKFCAYMGATLTAFASDLSGLDNLPPPETPEDDSKMIHVSVDVEYDNGSAFLMLKADNMENTVGITSAEFSIEGVSATLSAELVTDSDSIITGRPGWTEHYANLKYGAFASHTNKITESGIICVIEFDISGIGPNDEFTFRIRDLFFGNTVEGELVNGRAGGVRYVMAHPAVKIATPPAI